MSQIYYCPKCKKTFSSEEPAYICNCGGSLIATGIPAEAWRNFSDQEKAARKAGWDSNHSASLFGLPGAKAQMQAQVQQQSNMPYQSQAPSQPQANYSYEMQEQTKYLKKLAHDVHFLYTITVIQLILWILGILLILAKFM